MLIVFIFFVVAVGLILRCPKCKTWFSFIPHSVVDEQGLPTNKQVNICRKCNHGVRFTKTR